MRLGRENALIVLGMVLATLPLIGIPSAFKIKLASGIGVMVMVVGWSVRHRVMVLKQKMTQVSKNTVPFV